MGKKVVKPQSWVVRVLYLQETTTRLQTTRQLTSHPNGQNCLLDGENAPEAPVKEIKEKWRLLPAFLPEPHAAAVCHLAQWKEGFMVSGFRTLFGAFVALGVLFLSGKVKKALTEYEGKLKAGEFKEFNS